MNTALPAVMSTAACPVIAADSVTDVPTARAANMQGTSTIADAMRCNAWVTAPTAAVVARVVCEARIPALAASQATRPTGKTLQIE